MIAVSPYKPPKTSKQRQLQNSTTGCLEKRKEKLLVKPKLNGKNPSYKALLQFLKIIFLIVSFGENFFWGSLCW